MFKSVEFQELKNYTSFRFEESIYAPMHVKENKMARKLGDDILVRVPPRYKVFVEVLFTLRHITLGYHSGEAYGLPCWEQAVCYAQLFSRDEIDETIDDILRRGPEFTRSQFVVTAA